VSALEIHPPLDRQSAVPIFEQIEGRLRNAIASGELRVHERIPSERELSAQLGVSRMTIRQALTRMVAAGDLYTRSGKGTFVGERKIEQPLQRLTSFTEDMRARGLRPSTRVIEQELIRAPFELAAVLGRSAGTEVARVARLRLADDRPVAIEVTHLPHDVCPGLLRHDLAQRSLYDVLRAEYGLALHAARGTIEASRPTREERALLDLPAGVPILRLRRVTEGADGRVVEFVQAAYHGDRFQLHVELR